MLPNITINYSAIFVAMLVNFIFGWAWYGPLFGKKWAGYLKIDISQPPPKGTMVKPLIFQVVGLFLMTYVLAHGIEVWRPTSWNAGSDAPAFIYGFFGGFYVWLGYYIPLLLGQVSWENRPWGLFGINAAYHFLNLQIAGMILAYWK